MSRVRSGRTAKPLDRSDTDVGRVEPIAIVGIGCRFPGADGPAAFWDLIREQRCSVREVPEHRVELGFNIHDVLDTRPGMPGKIASPLYGFVDHPELFDPLPFGLTPRDAVGMEPQQRLVVEVVWDALADAGIPVESLEGERVAVMIGHMAEDYSREQIAALGEEGYRRSIDVWSAAGIARAAVSGRVSFLLGVRGPSFTVDTACSSSLLTVHLACQSLWTGESRYAIAGGVNMFLSPEGMIALSRVGMLATDGHCKAFDDRADGFVRAEGAGVVVLRPLADALEANDPIYAVVRGTGFSADGRDGGHMMAPGRDGQLQAMDDAYRRAGIDPSTVDFVEAHGTGTTVGDPVEIQALNAVMGPGRSPERPLKVSSVKGNIGHAESASGIAGLIKAALAARHRALPAQLHFQTPSKAIPWDDMPIRVQTEHEDWPADAPLRIGVNSFGISGTNAHAILDAPPVAAQCEPRQAAAPSEQLFLLSGHSAEALRGNAARLRDQIEAGSNSGDDAPDLSDLAYTLDRRRSHRGHRLSLVAGDRSVLAKELSAFVDGTPGKRTRSARADVGRAAPVAMVFSGHGGHWPGMGCELLETEPAFRYAVEEWDAALRDHVDWSFIDVLRSRNREPIFERADVLQSTVTGMAIGLARLWRYYGVEPTHVVGHSVGEIAAAHVAGCIDLASAARIATARGRVIRECTEPGAMAVAACPPDTLQKDLEQRRERDGESIWIAGENAPSLSIVSGDEAAIQRLLTDLEARGVFARPLAVEYASHCPAMDSASAALREALGGVHAHPGKLGFISTVTGASLDGSELGADYWARNLRAPVLLSAGVRSLLDAGSEILLEVSPHPVLGAALAELAAEAQGKETPAVLPSLRRDEAERAALLASLGGLFTRGAAVDLSTVAPTGQVVSTPLYAYQRKEYWFGPKRGTASAPARRVFGGLQGTEPRRTESATQPARRYWQIELTESNALPESERIRLALAAAAEEWPEGASGIDDLEFGEPWPDPGEARTLQVVVDRDDDSARIEIASREPAGSDWQTHATARVWRTEPLSTAGAEPCLDAASRPRVAVLEEDGFDSAIAACRTLFQEEVCPEVADGTFRWAGVRETQLPGLAERARGFHSVRLQPVAAEGAGSFERFESDAEFRSEDGELLGTMRGLSATLGRTPRANGTPRFAAREWSRIELASLPEDPTADPREWWIVGNDARLTRVLRRAGLYHRELPNPTAAARALADGAKPMPRGIVMCSASPDPRELAELLRATRELASSVERLWLVTQDTQDVQGGESNSGAPGTAGAEGVRGAGAAWEAIGRLQVSLADLPVRTVDLSWDPSAAECRALIRLLRTQPTDRALVLREDALFVPRFVERAQSLAPKVPSREATTGSERAFELRVVDASLLDSLAFIESGGVGPPAPDEVEIEVRAAGLSFLDVFASMGAASPTAHEWTESIGWECSGVVRRIGDDVTDLAVGDRVFGFARGAAASRVRTPAALVVRQPAGLSDTAAAAAPLAEVVARHALDRIARLRAGDRIVIHSAGGALGQAAVRLALRRGAHVTATAGGEHRRAALRALGADLVLDSRATQLVRSLGRWAGARGIDAVLDLAPGRALFEREAIYEKLAPGARCVVVEHPEFELGPVGPRSSHAASATARPARVHRIDPIGLLRTKPEELMPLLEELAREIESEHTTIDEPTVFPVAQSMRALRYLSQRRHVGKVVLSLVDRGPLVLRADPAAEDWLCGERVVLVGGPTGVARGIRSSLERAGAVVEFRELAEAPVGVLQHDVVGLVIVGEPDLELARKCCEVATWATLQFVWFVAERSAPPEGRDCSQSNSELANLVAKESAAGSSVSLVSFACDAEATASGLEPDVLRRQLESTNGEWIVVPESFDLTASPAEIRARFEHPWLGDMLRTALATGEASAHSMDEAESARVDLAALDLGEREGLIRSELASALGRVLQLTGPLVDQLDWSCAANDLGLDSLMALELKLVLEARIGIELDLASLFDGTPLAELAGRLAAESNSAQEVQQ